MYIYKKKLPRRVAKILRPRSADFTSQCRSLPRPSVDPRFFGALSDGDVEKRDIDRSDVNVSELSTNNLISSNLIS